MEGDKTGGAAFPTIANVAHNPDWVTEDGMSLRDYFAGQALSSEAMFRAYHKTPNLMAVYAYQVADEMLKLRSRNPEKK